MKGNGGLAGQHAQCTREKRTGITYTLHRHYMAKKQEYMIYMMKNDF